MAALRDFFDALNEEEAKFLPPLVSDTLGLYLRCSISELDWFRYNIIRANDPTDEQQEQFYILQLGVTRLIKLALEARNAFDVPAVTFPRTRKVTLPTLKIASAIGMIQHGRRVAQSVAQGLGEVKKVGTKHYVITLCRDLPDYAYYERSVLEHYNAESNRRFDSLLQSKNAKAVDYEVNEKLHKLVFPFKKHYMGYDADPLLDEYFFGLAYHEASLYEGFDTFHYATQFGGVRFQSYVLALVFLIAISIRHERFAEALIEKDSSIRLENILTISADTGGLVQSILDAVNYFGQSTKDFEEIDIDAARQIFDILSIGRNNVNLVDAPGSPIPPLIQTSDDGVIRCQSGARSEPFRFLLESLRHYYPKDYDKSQQQRELSLQRAIQRILNNCIDGLDYRTNILAKVGGNTLTDIDLAILDSRMGVIILCQLKHQELYGFNLHAMKIRNERLIKQCVEWLHALDKWVATQGDHGIKDSLRLPRGFPQYTICKLIISRHYSYPLREAISDNRILYSNWVQFFNAVEILKKKVHGRNIRGLMDVLRETRDLSAPPEHLPEPRTEWTIKELSFVTQRKE